MKDWDHVKDRVHELYISQNRPLHEVIRFMGVHHGFNASKRAYKTKLKEWGYEKYNTGVQCGSRPGIPRSQSAVNSISLTAPYQSNMTTHFLPILQCVLNLSSSSSCLESVLKPAHLQSSPLPELTAEQVSTLGNAGPWPLSGPSAYPPQIEQNDQPDSYALVGPSSMTHPLSHDSTFSPGQPSDDIDKQDEDGRTKLHPSVIIGSAQEVKDLLSLGAATNISDFQGNQPIHCAASRASESTLRLLLKQGVDVNAKGRAGMTPLHACVKFPKTLKLLLETDCAISAQDDQGDTPLHYALSSTLVDMPLERSPVVKLIHSGADINARNHAHITPFHMLLGKKWMESKHSTSLLVMCLENGALIDAKTVDGRLPFDVFLENSHFRWAESRHPRSEGAKEVGKRNRDFKEFLVRGAEPNTRLISGQTLLNEVLNRRTRCYGGDYDLAMLLCRTANLNTAGLQGDYPLHCLLRNLPAGRPSENIHIFKDFLRPGVDFNSTNEAGESPLMVFLRHPGYAAGYRNGCKDVAGLLLESGANPMQRNQEGDLPIYVAARQNYFSSKKEILELLLKATGLSGMTSNWAGSGGHPHPDDDWWIEYRGLYRSYSQQRLTDLMAFSHLLPKDISQPITQAALNVLVDKFLSSAKTSCMGLKEMQGLQSSDTRKVCNHFAAILRDCQALEIDVDQKWYHFLLDMFD